MRSLLSGRNVKITALRDSDLEVMENWFNDVNFLRLYDMLPALPQRQQELKKLMDSFSDSLERYLFALRHREEDKLIGILGFDDIIWSNGVATMFIGIGDPDYTAKGLGKEALQLLLDFGFNELNFHRIQLNVIAYNEAALNLYEGLGFVKEGTCREFIFRDGKRYDMYLYSLLRHEWRG